MEDKKVINIRQNDEGGIVIKQHEPKTTNPPVQKPAPTRDGGQQPKKPNSPPPHKK
jgi:hypothetical protein